ncbi:MAG: glycosyltransferase family 9 protein [Ignavibacteriaceae bacterium]|nr:glycosyltransferase family 9 protein [Ignavibacteriaceae bacterium]
MILKTDCKFFPGDRPCSFNKNLGIKCDDCKYYSPVIYKILIIKLEAAGDVLRTTSLLFALKDKYPNSHICWITKRNSIPLFNNNILIDEVIAFEAPELNARLQTEEFDLLIHPDASPVSSAIASIVKAKEKRGYILNTKGKVVPANSAAEEWLEMGAFDDLKKKNKKTYQQILHEIAEVDYNKGEIIINLSPAELLFLEDFRKRNALGKFKHIIGLNTGASKRWQLKQWRFEGYKELILKLTERKDVGILLYGGPEEVEKNKQLKKLFPALIDTGTENSLRQFFALLNLSDVVITGDTLALHAATALKKNIICVFGPTSSNEIEDYGRVIKISPKMDCLVCYKPTCDFKPNCMDLISSDDIYNEVIKLI